MDTRQAFRWQILAPCGILAIILIGASRTEEPHSSSKVFPLFEKEDFLEHLLLVSRTACTTCVFSFISKMDDDVGAAHPSSDGPLESEDDSEDESSTPCSSEPSSGGGGVSFLVPVDVAEGNLGEGFGPIEGLLEKSEGAGSGCLAPRAWDVGGRHPELIVIRMFR